MPPRLISTPFGATGSSCFALAPVPPAKLTPKNRASRARSPPDSPGARPAERRPRASPSGGARAISEQPRLLDRFVGRRSHEILPARVACLESGEDVGRRNREIVGLVLPDGHDAPGLDEQVAKVMPRGWDRCCREIEDPARRGLSRGVHVHLHRPLEEPPGGL